SVCWLEDSVFTSIINYQFFSDRSLGKNFLVYWFIFLIAYASSPRNYGHVLNIRAVGKRQIQQMVD
ncbi:hypothetical protein, partial [Nostoc sp.]|uniref:hypothetical protein n=1 Tax=Nostoc sp. TaxID=1180 RepID=UPI002FFD1954